MKKTIKIVIAIAVVVIILIVVGVLVIGKSLGRKDTNTVTNTNGLGTNQLTNINNANSNDNVNAAPIISTNRELTVEGMVLLKGYKTPSESYGITTTDGNEIGLGKYDSMKEQFRSFIGDKIKVTFSSVCRSTSDNCCLTLFFYCGTVKSWEPINVNK